jgi:CRP/FNR family transcriptional regulator, anaerobic regulatory protein
MLAQAQTNLAPKVDFTKLATCRGFPQQTAGRIMAVSTLEKKAPGQNMFSEGDNADNLYEVVSGTLRLYKLLPDGRRQITGFLCAGHILGLAPEGSYIYSAEAITEVTLFRYSRRALERLMDEVPGFARRLLTVTSHELRAAQDQMLMLGRKTALEKVASFLLLMAEQQGSDEAAEVSVPMSRADIADYLGLTIETVSRTFTKLKVDRVISLRARNRVEIVDRDLLEQFAAGDGDRDL